MRVLYLDSGMRRAVLYPTESVDILGFNRSKTIGKLERKVLSPDAVVGKLMLYTVRVLEGTVLYL